MNKQKYLVVLFALFSFIILNCLITYTIYNSKQKNNDIFRLHIVANSNSVTDQLVKLKVNENIQNYISTLNLDNLDNEKVIDILKNNSDNILEIANTTLEKNNKEYTANLQIGKILYEEKDSTLIHMQKGVYNSAKIILGSGSGKNIWSFISPNKENISKIKKYETIMPGISNIYNENEQINYSSKILELLNK